MTDAVKARLITQKLLAHSQKTGVSFPHILTSFLIERLVARLVAKPVLKMSLVFKGGFVGLRVYHNDRFTVDLDALLFKSDLRKTLAKVREAAETDFGDGVWFVYENEVDLATQGEYGGVRQVFRAGLGEKLKDIKRAQIVNFDLGIGDPVTPGPVQMTTNSLVLEQDFSWAVYPVETILAEKLHAIVERGSLNSRSKDVHDIATFLPLAETETLREAIASCFEFRKTTIPKSFSSLAESLDTSTMERGWKSAMVSVPGASSFQDEFKQMIQLLKKMKL